MMTLESLGFGLSPVETRDGSEVWQIETPFRLANEFPFDIFVEQIGNVFHVFDDGLTRHDLRALGIDLSDGERVESLRRVIQKYGVAFNKDFSFEAFGDIEHAGEILSKYLSAMVQLDFWGGSQ